jgi:enoyl-CoA hydratase
MQTFQHIEYEQQDAIGIVRLNRPRYRNAQSRLMLDEMTAAFDHAGHDQSVRCIILCGAGDHFSAGHDLGTPEEMAARGTQPYGDGYLGRLERSWHLYVEHSLRWRDVRKPTIASVQGYCIFGGFLIASCMDLIIAADDAMFLPSHLQLHTAPWDLGIRQAKRILFENRFVPAREALSLGLLTEVVPRAQLWEATLAQARRIADNDLLTLRMTKQSINAAQDAMGYRTALQNAHSNYMLMEVARVAGGGGAAGGAAEPGRRRLGGVARALEKLREAPEGGSGG